MDMNKKETQDQLEKAILRGIDQFAEFVALNIKSYENEPSSQAFYNVTGDDYDERRSIAREIAREVMLLNKLSERYGVVSDNSKSISIYEKLKHQSAVQKLLKKQ